MKEHHTHSSWPTARRRTRSQHRANRQVPALRETLPAGTAARLRTGVHLLRASPGLSLYLGGGLAVWLGSRTLAGQGLTHSAVGAVLGDAARWLALIVVVTAYLGRAGHLAVVRAGLAQACLVLASQPLLPAPASRRQQLQMHLARWVLSVASARD